MKRKKVVAELFKKEMNEFQRLDDVCGSISVWQHNVHYNDKIHITNLLLGITTRLNKITVPFKTIHAIRREVRPYEHYDGLKKVLDKLDNYIADLETKKSQKFHKFRVE
jgi:hypothetical protein